TASSSIISAWLFSQRVNRRLVNIAWRKRWFVLRSGRMSGNPDVLEYYRNDHSKKPIRVIDLNECEVQKQSELSFFRKEFQNNYVFIVKTTFRTFYLVAKTEEEMQTWVNNISQICNFGPMDDRTDSSESLSHTNSSLQPSPAVSTHTSRITDPSFSVQDSTTDTVTTEESRSESDSSLPPDYLVLSQCKTGKINFISFFSRCNSLSNSDRSLEQNSSDDVFIDGSSPQLGCNSLQPLCTGGVQQDSLLIANDSPVPKGLEISEPTINDFSSSSPLLVQSIPQVFQFDKNHNTLPFGVTEHHILSNTPPPRPPKPSRFSERKPIELAHIVLKNGDGAYALQPALVPRRISLSSLESVRSWKTDLEENFLRSRNKRLSLNLPGKPMALCSSTTDSSEDSYVPMNPGASSPASVSECSSDGYIPMSPAPFSLATVDKMSSPLPALPDDLEPPPVNRDLKPRRRARPPPLDLRSLSTIRENTTHPVLTRMWTVPYNRTNCISPECCCPNSAKSFGSIVPGEEEENYVSMEQARMHLSSSLNGSFPWFRKFNLDYLALDFNSASQSPVQKKPFLSEDERVDYVQVDEKKTQALQNTKQEWTDVRQSKL
uniref:GRB2 associated binding protein 3 n=1 Tax=Latimeria chalumnae TaxID=7897 RepID=H3B9R7_LATCH